MDTKWLLDLLLITRQKVLNICLTIEYSNLFPFYLKQRGSHQLKWCHQQLRSECVLASPTGPWKHPCCPEQPCFEGVRPALGLHLLPGRRKINLLKLPKSMKNYKIICCHAADKWYKQKSKSKSFFFLIKHTFYQTMCMFSIKKCCTFLHSLWTYNSFCF